MLSDMMLCYGKGTGFTYSNQLGESLLRKLLDLSLSFFYCTFRFYVSGQSLAEGMIEELSRSSNK